MMTGLDVYNKAIMLLGYDQCEINHGAQDEILPKALDVINNIMIDLNLSLIDSLADEIKGTLKQTDALCTGTAMLISMLQGDTNKNVIFTGLYNAKRAIALGGKAYIEDVLPIDDGGV